MTTKTLLLMRHAKSSWDDPALNDFDRPLNRRGRKAAKRIGRLLKELPFSVDVVLSSTSVRTRETCELVFETFATLPTIIWQDDLYHAGPQMIIELLRQLDDRMRCVLLVGHNPGLEEFTTELSGNETEFPTAALAILELQIEHWADFDSHSRARMTQMYRPKDLNDD